jgi:hypothetical protein
MKMEESVPKHRHIKFRLRGITHKKAYNIQNTGKVCNQEYYLLFITFIHLKTPDAGQAQEVNNLEWGKPFLFSQSNADFPAAQHLI